MTLLAKAAALALAGFNLIAPAQHKAPRPVAHAHEPVTSLGPAAAPISIVAFIDLECPYSAATLPLVEAYARAHPAQVHLQLRNFPLNQHLASPLAHEAALAAGAQDRFFQMVDLIQANQTLLTRDQYLHYAEALHLDLTRFRADLDSHRFLPQIQTEVAEGNAIGIEVTPTLFVNGRQLSGAQDAPTLAALFKDAIPAATIPQLADTDAPTIPKDLWQQMLQSNSPAIGPTDAPVTIVEFTDFQCPFCRRSAEPLHQLIAASGGNVRWIYRSFPLEIHDQAQLAAEAALAAGAQGKFWPMHDLLFAHQDTLDRAHIEAAARELNLNLTQFQQDLASGRFRAAIASDRLLGTQGGVDGTPSFFINGRLLTGTRTLPELQQAVALATQDLSLPNTRDPARPTIQNASSQKSTQPTDHLIAGSPTAPNTILWFSDVEAAAAPAIGQIVQNLITQHGPQLRVALKSYALPDHPAAALTHRALLAAAAQDRFWPMYTRLAGHTLPKEPTAARAQILAAAIRAALEPTAFTQALDSQALTPQIEADRAEATTRGIRGVPVLFLNNKRVDGIQPLPLYQSYLQTNQAQAAPPR